MLAVGFAGPTVSTMSCGGVQSGCETASILAMKLFSMSVILRSRCAASSSCPENPSMLTDSASNWAFASSILRP